MRRDPLGGGPAASASRRSGVKIARNSCASYAAQTTCLPLLPTYFPCGRRSLDGPRSRRMTTDDGAAAVQMVKKSSKGKSARGRPVIRAEEGRTGGRVLQE